MKQVQEVAPPGFGHTKGDKEKGVKKGGTAAAFDRARKEGRFKGSKSDMFAIMWSQKNKGDKPHYKPDTDKKYKKYQADESFEINKKDHKTAQKKAKIRNLAKGNQNPNEKAAAERKLGGPKLMGESQSCPKGQYYCNDDEKCKPIPEGHHVMKDGTLMKGEKHGMDEEKKNCGCGKDPCITYGKKKKVEEGAAWTKKSGKKESGGLNEKGRKSYERENPGSDLKAPSKKVGNKRRASFCARMKGMRKRQKPSNNTGDDRLSKSLRAWNCGYEPEGTTISEKPIFDYQELISEKNKSGDSSLHDWFNKSKSSDGKPGWVQAGGKFAGKPCAKQPGQVTKPKCISSKMKRNMSKDEEEAAHNRKQRQDPNPERSGKAKNVATECWKGYKKKGMKKKGDRIVPNCVPEEKEMELKEYSPNVTYQAKGGKKSGKLGKSSVYSLRDKDESKKEFRKSQVKDIKGGYLKTEENLPVNEGKGEKDACYHKVKSRFKIWPSAYASGALVKCRKKGADNWGNSTKKEELTFEGWQERAKDAMKKVVGKKKTKHDYGSRDAGAEAKKRLKKKDHETVNFLDPDD